MANRITAEIRWTTSSRPVTSWTWFPTRGRDAIWPGAPSMPCWNATGTERVAANHVFILEELRRHVERERDRLSQEVFRALLESGRMRFLVVAEDLKFNRLPERIEVPRAKQANREDGSPYSATSRQNQGRRPQPVREQGRDVSRSTSAALLLVPQPLPQGLLRAGVEAAPHLRRFHRDAAG